MKIILVAVGLVFAPMQACADCAWVLWGTIEVVDRFEGNERAIVQTTGYAPMRGFESKRECEAAASSRQEPWPTLPLHVGEQRRAHVCFPDTVDPRGPKGSGR